MEILYSILAVVLLWRRQMSNSLVAQGGTSCDNDNCGDGFDVKNVLVSCPSYVVRLSNTAAMLANGSFRRLSEKGFAQ